MKLKPIKIKNRLVGENRPCYIIAEIGSNFDGDINKAKKLIKKAKEAGADAAKFQSFETNKILSRNGFEEKVSFQSIWKKSVWDTYKNAELPIKWIKILCIKKIIKNLSLEINLNTILEEREIIL